MRISIIQIGTYEHSLDLQHHRRLLQMVALIVTFNMFFLCGSGDPNQGQDMHQLYC